MAEENSEPKKKSVLHLWIGGALLIVGVLAVISGISGLLDNRQRLVAPNGIITVEVVDTPETRQQGLSGRESLSANEGMLFVFDQATEGNCLWMKDMNFSIDMVWLNEDKRVVTVASNVAPETYPEETFCPSEPAKYALEVAENRAKELGIKEDEQLRF